MKPTRTDTITCAQPKGRPALTALTVGLALCLSPLLLEQRAEAQEFRLHIEPAAAFWADKPQSSRWGPGFAIAIRPGITLGDHVSLQATYSALMISAGEDIDHAGNAHFFMGGVRFRPFASFSPERGDLAGLFIDGNAGYVRTGDEDRFGFDVGAGYNFPVTDWLAVGPSLRYTQIVQPDGIDGIDANDAHLVSGGVNFTFGPANKSADPVCPECEACAECAPAAAIVEPTPHVAADNDRDRDGIGDAYDRCPTRYGPAATLGCPVDPCTGDPLIVLVQFPFDSAGGLPSPRDDDPSTMDPVLDEVAAAIAQDPSCRVCIVGHASEEGQVEHNQTLSEKRAQSVKDYLIVRGLAGRDIPTIGMGVSCQLEPKESLELNRRVSFVRLAEGASCPTTCPE